MKRVLSFLIGLAAVLLFSGRARASEPDACVSEAALRSLDACSNITAGALDTGARGPRPRVSFHEQVRQEKRLKEPAPGAPIGGIGDEILDARLTRAKQRQKGLLVLAISQTEDVLQSTPPSATDRPIILRRRRSCSTATS
jgi:hypothetical protein